MRRVTLVVLVAALCAPPVARADEEIADLAVSFSVRNVNRSRAPCEADGLTYHVRGSLVAPRRALRSTMRAATLLLHGGMVPQQLWRYPLPGYDFAADMARRGHVTVAIDLLGYGASLREDGPDGREVCLGSHADMANQIIGHLREGTYQIGGGINAPRFRRVALGGLSVGGWLTEIAGVSFEGADALLVMGFNDVLVNPTPQFVAAASDVPRWGIGCAQGGEPKYGNGGPPGYFLSWPDDVVTGYMFHDAEPSVASTWTHVRERDNCGVLSSDGLSLAVNSALAATIHVPVLVAYGEHDLLFAPGSGEQQAARYVGSDDVTRIVMEGAGHVFHLERRAPEYRARISGWLRARGF